MAACQARPEEFPYASPVACACRLLPLAAQLQDEKGVEPEALKVGEKEVSIQGLAERVSEDPWPISREEMALKEGIVLIDHELVTLLRHFGVAAESEDASPRIIGPLVLKCASES